MKTTKYLKGHQSNGAMENCVQELSGFVGMGMKREALSLTRRVLRNRAVKAEEFDEAVKTLLTLETRLRRWSQLIQSAYARLSKRKQQAVRFSMLCFYTFIKEYETASRFITHRTNGKFGLTELAAALDVWFALGRKDEMEKLARRLPWAIRVAEQPVMRTKLRCCLAEYHARTGNWEKAIRTYEEVMHENAGAMREDDIFFPDAVTGIVEIQAARALRAIQQEFQLLEKFNQTFDLTEATILPGNEKTRHEAASKHFRRLEKILEKIVPEKRRKELRIDT